MIPKRLTDEIESWIDGRKYGCIEINFQDGKILNFNKRQSIRLEFMKTNSQDTKGTVISNEEIKLAG